MELLVGPSVICTGDFSLGRLRHRKWSRRESVRHTLFTTLLRSHTPSLLPYPTDCTDHVCHTRGRVTNEHQKVERRRGGHGDPSSSSQVQSNLVCPFSDSPSPVYTFPKYSPNFVHFSVLGGMGQQTSIWSCLNCTLHGDFLRLLLLSSGSLLMEYPEEVCFVNIIHLSLWRFSSYAISPLEWNVNPCVSNPWPLWSFVWSSCGSLCLWPLTSLISLFFL